jgi:hypothetical protein
LQNFARVSILRLTNGNGSTIPVDKRSRTSKAASRKSH